VGLQFITVACAIYGNDTLRNTGRTLIWGSHSPQHGVENVKTLVANDENGFIVLTFRTLIGTKVNRQPIGKSEKKFKE
jgi:hypothetical protein